MKRYQSPIPRAALAFAAVALTAMTIGAWVIAPAKMGPGNPDARTLAVASSVVPAEVGQDVLRIDVVAVRQPALTTVLLRHIQGVAKHKQQS